MKRSLAIGQNKTHALVDGLALCGTQIERDLPTRTDFAIQQWAAIATFSGSCATCIHELKSDPTVAKYAK